MQFAPQNYPFVTLAKGIGILLVIAGHFTCPHYMPESYLELKDWIYSFHMPLFMMLAGFLFQNSLARTAASGKPLDIPRFIGKKFKRLMVPYLSISLLIAGTNWVLGHFLTVREPVTLSYFLRMFYENVGGSAVFLWFVYTLFIIFLLAAVATRLPGGVFLWLGILAPILLFLPLPSTFYLSYTGNNLIYFYAGMCSYAFFCRPRRHMWLYALCGAVVYIATFHWQAEGYAGKLLRVLCGISGSFTLVALISALFPSACGTTQQDSANPACRILSALGRYSAQIYLLHMAGVYAVRLAYEQIGLYTPATYFAALLFALLAGSLLPIVLVQQVFRRSPLLTFLTGGK